MPLLAIDPDDPRVRVQQLDPPIPERTILVAVPRGRVEKTAEQFVERAVALGAALSESWCSTLGGGDGRSAASR